MTLFSKYYNLSLIKQENFDYIHNSYMELKYYGKNNIHFTNDFIRIQGESLYDLCWNVNIDSESYKTLSLFVMELLRQASRYMDDPVIYVSDFSESDENVDIESGFYKITG